MLKILVLFVICLTLVHQIIASSNQNFYIGAVVEYSTIIDGSKNVLTNLELNVDQYVDFIQQAKQQGADIIVFPEYGLTSTKFPDIVEDALQYTSLVPDPKEKINPCDQKRTERTVSPWSSIITRLSCQAQKSQIYLVINLPERYEDKKSNKTLLYNANVVFDRDGTVIARYRKYNLFNELAFNKTSSPDIITFKTDFNVTFGIFTCFDILFAQPALAFTSMNDVTDIVFPTAWFSELPFLTAIETQLGWVRAYGMNLLAANNDDPEKAGGGSGIYSSVHGVLDYIVPARKESRLIVAHIPIVENKDKKSKPNSVSKRPTLFTTSSQDTAFMKTLKENVTLYTTKSIDKDEMVNEELCHGKFCCKFTVKSTSQTRNSYYYRLVVFSGDRKFGVETDRIQVCGIMACRTDSLESCGDRLYDTNESKKFTEIRITGSFDDDGKQYVHLPLTVQYKLQPLDFDEYTYKVDYKGNCVTNIEMKTNKDVDDLLGFGIYGIKKSAATRQWSTVIVSIILILIQFVWNKYNQ